MADLDRPEVAEELRVTTPDGGDAAPWRRLRSLPSRIVVSVFAAALVTALVVTWTSTQSIESFLLHKIDQRFPAVLSSAIERLDLWYAQRQLDVDGFAHAPAIQNNAASLRSGGEHAARGRERMRGYLEVVLEGFPQYAAIFVMAPGGNDAIWLGEHFDLPAPLRERLSTVSEPGVGDFARISGRSVQIASAPIADVRGEPGGTLHAVVDADAVARVLGAGRAGWMGRITIVGSDGILLARSSGGAASERYDRPLPSPGAPAVVGDDIDGNGERVIWSAVRFPRFGWTLVIEQAHAEAFAPVGAMIRKNLGINLAIVLFFGLIALQMARSIVKPILALSEAALRIATGEADVSIPEPTSDDEIGVLTSAFREMTDRLHRNQEALERSRAEVEEGNRQLLEQNEQLHRVNEVLEQLSITDGLTKLHNHRFFQDHLRREMRRSARTSEELALILIDIDDFKGLNDRFGHSVGDAVLRRVADVMNEVIRETDLLARYGGEEFALLASQTSKDGALALAEKVRLAVSEARFSIVDVAGPTQIAITVSVGVAAFRGDEKAFFNEADRALYRAKEEGKDCVATFW